MNEQELNKRLLGLMDAIEKNQSLIAELLDIISGLTARVKELEK